MKMAREQRRRRNDYMRVYMRKRYWRLKRERQGNHHRRWSPEELEWLHHAFPNQNTKRLAIAMGRTVIAVSACAHTHGIRKSDEFYRSEASGRMSREDHRGRAHCYPKGHVPANKGLRRPGYAPGRMRETQFVKGQKSGNWMPLQSERVNEEGYLYRKVGESGYMPSDWMLVHRLVWMAANGDIPPGCCIAFKDRDKSNVALENLECITMRENMARNTIHNLPKALKEVIQLRGALVRQIKRRSGRREKQDRGPAQPSLRSPRGPEGREETDGSRTRKDYRSRRERHRAIREGRG